MVTLIQELARFGPVCFGRQLWMDAMLLALCTQWLCSWLAVVNVRVNVNVVCSVVDLWASQRRWRRQLSISVQWWTVAVC